MCRYHLRAAWAFLLLAVSPFLPLHADQSPTAVLVQPETPYLEPLREPGDLAGVPEVLRLQPATVAAAATLESLREQPVLPGVPYQDGFQRSAGEQRVTVAVAPTAWMGGAAGELRPQDEEAPASWRGRFVVEEAHAFRVALRDVELPTGARIWVYAGDLRLGPYGSEMLGPDGTLWLPPAPGPEVVVEIELPVDSTKTTTRLSFVVGDVMEIVATAEQTAIDPQVWTNCDIDAMCIGSGSLAVIDSLRDAAARLSFVVGGGSFLCSGSLMNDKDTTGFRPYLLTANHCFSSQSSASSLVAYFDYRTNACNGSAPSLFSVPSVAGSTLLASNAVSDFTLVELSAVPLAGTVSFLGWTTTDPTTGRSMYRVSHPAGTTQKYSASQYVGSAGIVCGGLPVSDFHYSDQFAGSTAGGSSGSPVVINDSGITRVVGQLLGACHFLNWDECSYSTFSNIDGAFSTTYPFVKHWLNDLMGCGDVHEPDNSSAAATPIASGTTQNHSICPVGDEDWMSISLPGTSAVTLQTSGVSGDTRMWLYNAALQLIEFDDDDGSGLFSRIDRVCGVNGLPAGTYYVQVDEFGDDDEIAAYAVSYSRQSCAGGGCPVSLTLSNTTITGTASHRASGTVTLGPSLVVAGNVEVIAGQRVEIRNGTRIGGVFSAGTHPSACTI